MYPFSFRFSIWNTILGSSLLTMPWGIGMAGFFPGIILNLLMSGLCLYTAYRLIVVHAYHGKKMDLFLHEITSQLTDIMLRIDRLHFRRWRRKYRGPRLESNISRQMGGIYCQNL